MTTTTNSHSIIFQAEIFSASSRRIKGAGREARQYEAATECNLLWVERGAAGNWQARRREGCIASFGADVTAEQAVEAAQRAAREMGYVFDRQAADAVSGARAARRDGEAVCLLRRVQLRNKAGLHLDLGMTRGSQSASELQQWRNGVVEIPAEIVARLRLLDQ